MKRILGILTLCTFFGGLVTYSVLTIGVIPTSIVWGGSIIGAALIVGVILLLAE